MRYNRRRGNKVPEGVQAAHKGRHRHALDDVVPLEQLKREVGALW